MFSFLEGKLIEIDKNTFLVENNGIGYEISYLQKAGSPQPEIGENISLYILSVFKEDSFYFYGFQEKSDKKLIKRLIKIPGIGIKVAMNILSNIDQNLLFEAIQNQDIGPIQNIPGIGKKTAQRIISELKEEITKIMEIIPSVGHSNPALNNVANALYNLGFKQDLVQDIIKQLKKETQSTDISFLIQKALSIISTMKK